MGQRIIFSQSGWTVHPAPSSNKYRTPDAAEFQGRTPILVNPSNRQILVGQPNWYHSTLADAFDTSEWNYSRGYFNGGPLWGGGKLQWEGEEHPNHEDIHSALTDAGYNIPASESAEDRFQRMDPEIFDNDELWNEIPDYGELEPDEWN